MPETDTVCGLLLALSAMLTDAARAPGAEGVNNIAMVQLPPAATEELQVSACVKSVALAPVMEMLVMLRVALPVLFRVTV